jgi:hypothetical protein
MMDHHQAGLPLISIQSQSWEDRTEGLQFHIRSSSSIPATMMNNQSSMLRISFQWIGHKDSRIVITVVKGSKVLFEIEDWTHPSDESSKIDRYYNYSHHYIKNLEVGSHFELHYAVGDDEYESFTELRIMDFNLSVQGNGDLYGGAVE